MTTKKRANLLLLLLLSSALVALSLESDPMKEHCSKECESIRGKHQRKECERLCVEREREGREWGVSQRNPEEEEREEEEEERSNPYFFDEQDFKHRIKSEHGHFKVLERFSKKSDLLQGIENYRLAILDANPRTFVLPSHWDAEEVFCVIGGRGRISLLQEENRESYDIQRGDILRVPVGTIVYVINKDEHEKLHIVMLLQPIFTPGHFKEFFGVGGEDPESFYRSFSKEVLEAAFNTPRGKLERVFGQHRKGGFVKASEEQIRAMSQKSQGGGWPFGQSRRPFNLFNKRPCHSNDHGELYEVDGKDYPQLRDLDIDVSIANISQGSMMAPFYNSRATKIALVVEGRGYFEMVCPHKSAQSQQEQEQEQQEQEGQEGGRGKHYKRVRSHLSPGSVFVIPAGHLVLAIAARNQNLQIICFGIKAKNNKKYFLAGRTNILNQMEGEAKELSFDVPAREVEEVFNTQRESIFLPGPEQQQEERWKGKRVAAYHWSPL